MRCVVIKEYGEAVENLVLEERPDIVATGEDVRVGVTATALNRADLLQRRGLYPAPANAPEYVRDIPGLEFTGHIDQMGERVTRWSGGERVFGIVPGGGCASQVVTSQDLVAEVPAGLGDEEAAAVPEAFMTAFDALVLQSDMQSGELVLIHAVASGVGTAAVQLVHAWGARAIGTTGSRHKLGKVSKLAPFFGINYRETDFKEAIEKEFGRDAVDVVLDVVGAPYWERNLALLAPRGRLILVGRLGGSDARTALAPLMSKRLRVMGTVMRPRSGLEKAAVLREFERQVLPLFAEGRLNSVIDSVYPIEDIRRATARMENNENVGKIVLTFG